MFLPFPSPGGSPKLAIVVSFFRGSFEWEGSVSANVLGLGAAGVERKNPRRRFCKSLRSLAGFGLARAFSTLSVTALRFGATELFFFGWVGRGMRASGGGRRLRTQGARCVAPSWANSGVPSIEIIIFFFCRWMLSFYVTHRGRGNAPGGTGGRLTQVNTAMTIPFQRVVDAGRLMVNKGVEAWGKRPHALVNTH